VALSATVALAVLVVPVIGERFGATALSTVQWFAALALAAVPFLVPELWKAGARRLAATGPQSRIRATRAVGAGS
jgi:Cation transporting ATPase, C-terminus